MSTNHTTEDELLVLRCRAGDTEALDTLLRRWQEPLWRHALRLTGEAEAAWDVLQEALVTIARDIRKLEAEGAFGVWAYRITGNKAHAWLRQHLRRRERETRYAEAQQIQTGESELPLPPPGEFKEWLRQLEPRDQILLKLRFVEDFSLEEIAHMLAIPTGTVKSRLHYAKEHLRTVMKGKL